MSPVDIDDLISACDECSGGASGQICAEGCSCLPCRVGSVPSADDSPANLASQLTEMALEYARLVQRVRSAQDEAEGFFSAPEQRKLFASLENIKTIRGDCLR